MRREIKPAIICEHCGTQLKPPKEARFCDYCKEKFPDDVDIDVTVFWKNPESRATRQEFCSMTCAKKWLLEFPYNKERVSFITLPYIFDFKQLVEFIEPQIAI